ncbi:MAG TPA: TonB-dependent receptor [bacterium]|nr:TonB-dependent receptor [bacterium]
MTRKGGETLRTIRIALLFTFAVPAFGQVDYYFAPVSVTASRMTRVLASETREWLVLDEDAIRRMPAQSIPDILRFSGVDISRRGPVAQADFSLRGSSFEQVLVLVDGVRMNDPQTGHFISDFPVAVQDIERIEILSGQASSVFGPEGFGGVIHIHTRTPERTQTRAQLRGGSFRTAGGWMVQSLRTGRWRHLLSAGREKSDGYREETGLDAWTANVRAVFQTSRLHWSNSLSAGRRDFGANGFYAPYPSHEITGTGIVQSALDWQAGAQTRVRARLFGRRHDDEFVLDANRPGWYRNTHRSKALGAEVQVNRFFSERMEAAAGAEWCAEALASPRLGDHDRMRLAVFGEAARRSGRGILVNAGIRADRLDGFGIRVSPSAGAAAAFRRHWRWRVSAGSIFRQPTFTELFYDSPSNRGNPDLGPESGQSIDAGLSFRRGALSLDWTLFGRRETGPIDWVETAPAVWTVRNLNDRMLLGMSLGAGWRRDAWEFRGFFQEIAYTADPGLRSAKYAANATRTLLTVSAGWEWPHRIRPLISFGYRRRRMMPDLTLTDLRFSKSWKSFSLHLDIHNVFGRIVEEIPGVPLPGRYAMIQAEIVR